jgi:hypothetical protein
MFNLFKFFYWFYPMVETFEPEEETKYECDEEYDHLYEP